VFAIVTTLLASGGAGASPNDRPSTSTARAYGISVSIPGQAGAGTPAIAAPGDVAQFIGDFSCCNGLVASGSVTASATASSGAAAASTATAQVDSLSLFGGEVTASVVARARAGARPGAATGDSSGSSAVVNGATAAAGQRIPLGDWGYATALVQGVTQSATPSPTYRAYVTALDIRITADHGGLPAGTVILVGYAEASAQAGEEAQPQTTPTTPTTPKKGKKHPGKPGGKGRATPLRPPPDVHPKLTAGRYVFPVYGPSSFIDSFGAFRGDVSGNWHHGDDIFAPLGAPILAVADGTVFSVGWNDVGGNRFWLRDTAGNEFYFAHLSAFTPLAVNGAQVKAGDVLGFVGNTGDAQGTPYHLHFEIHPNGLLGLGYDGAVDPTRYLLAWEHLQDVRFDAASGWIPSGQRSTAPPAGAILLQVSDISSANGLDPASLRRAMAPAAGGEGSLLGAELRRPARSLADRRGG
jgi:murein DD-endopeptidase MepM/ murein hydrolase activator NlpD